MRFQPARIGLANMPVEVTVPAISRFLDESRVLARLEIIRLLNVEMAHPKSTFEPVLSALAVDVQLASFIIHSACSAHFGGRANTCTLTEAFARMGITEFCRHLTSAVVQLRISKQPMPKYAAHGEEVGHLCEVIASASTKELALTAYCTGLCHDAGVPLMLEAVTDYQCVASRTLANDPGVVVLERDVHGFSHCDLAAELVAAMGFAPTVAAAVRLHHESARLLDVTGESARLLAMLLVAERVIAVAAGESPVVFGAVAEDDLRLACLQALEMESDQLDAIMIEMLGLSRMRRRHG